MKHKNDYTEVEIQNPLQIVNSSIHESEQSLKARKFRYGSQNSSINETGSIDFETEHDQESDPA